MIYKVSPEYSLKGAGKCVAESDDELLKCIKHAMALSPTGKVLVEQVWRLESQAPSNIKP